MVKAGILVFCAFVSLSTAATAQTVLTSSISTHSGAADTVTAIADSSAVAIHKVDTIASNLIMFAQTLKGTPYRYGCSDPKKGFDCSGFVKYVFNHFQFNVPRSSIDFTNVGKEIDLKDAIPGDLILFTGTDSRIRKVGHVGIITQVSDTIVFIHASSGKTAAVIETALNPHYQKRFIKVVRVM